MQPPLLHTIQDHSFWVTAERALFWEDENTLIVADVHLGKSGHFRKSGIGVPPSINKADLQRLVAQLYLFKAERLIIVGDFTHSEANKELDLFLKWRKDFASLQIDLVKGNHDVLADYWYEEGAITTSEWKLQVGPFLFLHDLKAQKKLTDEERKCYAFTGHVHPGISLTGKGRQSLRFSCFYFAKSYCILPAFSRFTGTYTVKPLKGEKVYVVAEDKVLLLK